MTSWSSQPDSAYPATQKHEKPLWQGPAAPEIAPQDVEAFMRHQRSRGLAPSTISNHVNYLHSIFGYAVRRSLAPPSNPVALADKIRVPHTSPDVKFLTVEEVEALLRAIPDDALGPTDRASSTLPPPTPDCAKASYAPCGGRTSTGRPE